MPLNVYIDGQKTDSKYMKNLVAVCNSFKDYDKINYVIYLHTDDVVNCKDKWPKLCRKKCYDLRIINTKSLSVVHQMNCDIALKEMLSQNSDVLIVSSSNEFETVSNTLRLRNVMVYGACNKRYKSKLKHIYDDVFAIKR